MATSKKENKHFLIIHVFQPWGVEVAKYLEKKREEEHNFSNGVPPWYIVSSSLDSKYVFGIRL